VLPAWLSPVFMELAFGFRMTTYVSQGPLPCRADDSGPSALTSENKSKTRFLRSFHSQSSREDSREERRVFGGPVSGTRPRPRTGLSHSKRPREPWIATSTVAETTVAQFSGLPTTTSRILLPSFHKHFLSSHPPFLSSRLYFLRSFNPSCTSVLEDSGSTGLRHL
jgi:hypothetical protein